MGRGGVRGTGDAHRPVTSRADDRRLMPRISSFYGITVTMHWDEGPHARPHFHARYAGSKASVALDGDVIAGWLPPRALRLVREWAAEHADELAANWVHARNDQPLVAIDPLP